MAKAALRQIVFGLATTGLLMGCVDGAGGSAGDTSPGMATTPTKRGGAQDVEAPEIFQTTDSALWDGRPSLGGIWVASPDAVDPERVVMFNPATGKSVTGALFRRERDNPGPTLQISSDAAEALGILAGQPVELRVTALRREEPEAPVVEEAAPIAEAAADATTDPAAPDAAPDAAAETTAIAAAALDAVDAGAEGAAVAADGATEALPAEPPAKKTWKERRAEAKAAREAKKAAAAAAAAGEVASPVAETGEAAASPDAIVVAPVETAPLDARSAEVTAEAATEATPAPVPEKKKTRRQIKAEQEAAAAAAAAAATEAAAAPVVSGRPIQVASFSKEENANRAVEALAKIGVTARTQKTDTKGKVVWGVVATGDDAMLKSIKGAGFADAYFLK